MKITIDIEINEVKQILEEFAPVQINKHHDCTCTHEKPVSKNPCAELVVNDCPTTPLPTRSTTNPVDTKTTENRSNKNLGKPGKLPPGNTENVWKPEELNLLRTCSSIKDAQFVYHSHFGDIRNDNAIYQRWNRLYKARSVMRIGGQVKVRDGLFHRNDIGTVSNFTDDRQYANVTFPGDSGNYQIAIEKLETIPAVDL